VVVHLPPAFSRGSSSRASADLDSDRRLEQSYVTATPNQIARQGIGVFSRAAASSNIMRGHVQERDNLPWIFLRNPVDLLAAPAIPGALTRGCCGDFFPAGLIRGDGS